MGLIRFPSAKSPRKPALNVLVTLREQRLEEGAAGGVVDVGGAEHRTLAERRYLRGNETDSDGILISIATVVYVVRDAFPVETTWTVTDGDRTQEIVAVRPLPGRYIELICESVA